MEQDTQTIRLGIQLGASVALVLLMTVIHGLGLMGASKLLGLGRDRLKERNFDLRSVLLLSELGLLLFAIHIIEIWVFAGFYIAVGAIQSVEDALYYSASAYATLGRTADYFPEAWRLIGAVEALIGFLLIGWSTAFMASTMSQLRK